MQHSDKNQVNFISQVDGATGCFAAARIVTVTVKRDAQFTVRRVSSGKDTTATTTIRTTHEHICSR